MSRGIYWTCLGSAALSGGGTRRLVSRKTRLRKSMDRSWTTLLALHQALGRCRTILGSLGGHCCHWRWDESWLDLRCIQASLGWWCSLFNNLVVKLFSALGYNGNSVGTDVIGFGPQKLDSACRVSQRVRRSLDCASISICNRRHETSPDRSWCFSGFEGELACKWCGTGEKVSVSYDRR